jgi:LacI family transcriptional regulator
MTGATAGNHARREATRLVTLKDVALRAGVSVATASRVINGSDRVVGAEHASRVLRAAQALQYVSNGPAQSLARSTSSVVGLLVHAVDDPYFAGIARGAMRVATDHGLLTMLASTQNDARLELDYVQRFRAQRVRGLLLAASGYDDADYVAGLGAALGAFSAAGGRVAFVSPHELPYATVVPGNREGGSQVAEHLAALGHTSVGVVTGPSGLTTVRHRLAGFTDAWGGAGGSLSDDAIVQGGFTRDGGYGATVELLGRYPGLTAIFALNDLMAVGVLAALRVLGRHVPRDVSVVGFDDVPIARELNPPLTTIRLPLDEMGALAMSMLLEDSATDLDRSHVPAELVRRESTAEVSSAGRAPSRARRPPR